VVKNAVTSPEQIITELRDAIGPVILISGVGLLLLTMTNLLGLAIDRARQLKAELPRRTGAEHAHVQEQVAIIYQRAKLTDAGAKTITVENVPGGSDGWNPKANK
jgi:hypothetical protein